MKFFSKKFFSSRIFIIASLGSVFLLYLFLQFLLLYSLPSSDPSQAGEDGLKKEKVQGEQDGTGFNYYKEIENLEEENMFVTRNPDLKERVSSPILSSSDPVLSPEAKDVVIVEFSDFTCSFCGEQEEVIRKIVEREYPGKVKLIRKDFPEFDKDSLSWQSARAARCAGAQDKFWEYHDLLFKTNQDFNQDLFFNLARQAGLDQKKFEKCYLNKETDGLIEDNLKEANDLGLSGVPYFYINKQEILGKINESELRDLIEMELEKIE